MSGVLFHTFLVSKLMASCVMVLRRGDRLILFVGFASNYCVWLLYFMLSSWVMDTGDSVGVVDTF